ncbi:Rap1a/Tai family immunity protein (plasmid) [Rhizobium leguminosarum]
MVDSMVKTGVKDEQLFDMVRESLVGKFCIPKEANVARAIVISCDWVTMHPEKGTWPAERSLMAAYNAAWPCDGN